MNAFLRATVAVLAVGTVCSASASSLGDATVQDLSETASRIATVEVVSVASDCESDRGCGVYAIVGRVAEAHAHDSGNALARGDRIEFCSQPFLEAGHTYIVFVSEEAAEKYPRCTGLVGWSAAFEERAGRIWRVRSPESRMTFPMLGRIWGTDSVLHATFREELGEALARRAARDSR